MYACIYIYIYHYYHYYYYCYYYYIILYYIILCYITLYYVISYHIVSYYIIIYIYHLSLSSLSLYLSLSISLSLCLSVSLSLCLSVSLSLSVSLCLSLCIDPFFVGTVLFKQLNFLTVKSFGLACFQEDAARVFRQCFGKGGDLTISVEADGAQRDFKVWSCLLAEWSDAWHRLALALYGVAFLVINLSLNSRERPCELEGYLPLPWTRHHHLPGLT